MNNIDEEEFFFPKINENEYEVDAMIDIETLDKELELELPIYPKIMKVWLV